MPILGTPFSVLDSNGYDIIARYAALHAQVACVGNLIANEVVVQFYSPNFLGGTSSIE